MSIELAEKILKRALINYPNLTPPKNRVADYDWKKLIHKYDSLFKRLRYE